MDCVNFRLEQHETEQNKEKINECSGSKIDGENHS